MEQNPSISWRVAVLDDTFWKLFWFPGTFQQTNISLPSRNFLRTWLGFTLLTKVSPSHLALHPA